MQPIIKRISLLAAGSLLFLGASTINADDDTTPPCTEEKKTVTGYWGGPDMGAVMAGLAQDIFKHYMCSSSNLCNESNWDNLAILLEDTHKAKGMNCECSSCTAIGPPDCSVVGVWCRCPDGEFIENNFIIGYLTDDAGTPKFCVEGTVKE